jgi:DNA-binding NtrC family response regulator
LKASFRILIVEDMESFRSAVSQLLGVYNDVSEADSLTSARALLQKHDFDVVILDKGLPDGDGTELLTEIKSSYPKIVVIVLTSDSDFSAVKHCIAKGADDYVIKSENVVPDLLIRIPVAVSKAAATRRLSGLEQLVKESIRYEIVGKDPSTIELRETILSLKGTNAHVMILGESGTGKELIARRLNSVEDDRNRPFVAINCGAIPENLVESELFGHRRGAFTGATQDHVGKFELAHGGDLFLDEIGELPLTNQVRLLRVIQEGELTRVGDSRVIRVNCRIIAATNRSLEKMVKEGKFREDLYHRLNVVCIATTPLRYRSSDIVDLARLFTLQIGGPNFKISDTAVRALKDYDWHGNIRELRNAVERAVIACRRRKSTTLNYEDISVRRSADVFGRRTRKFEECLPRDASEISRQHYEDFMKLVEREYFQSALEHLDGDTESLARQLGIARSTAFKKVKDLQVDVERRPARATPAMKEWHEKSILN